jgi:SH3 domain-containing YSC84-like protein 1
MKNVWMGVSLLAAVISLPAFGQKKEQERVASSGKVMQEIMNIPDDIPQDVLDKADCIVVLPSVLKFAMGIGGSYGRGVMTCRGGKDFKKPWGAPTMMALEGGSFGLQLGGQATDFVLLLMTPRSAENVLASKVKLGGDVSAAAGPVGRTASAETDVTMRAEILSYSRARGLFAGISLAGSTLRADNGANKNLYGKDVSAQDIVFNRAVQAPASAELLLATLNKKSPKNKSKEVAASGIGSGDPALTHATNVPPREANASAPRVLNTYFGLGAGAI